MWYVSEVTEEFPSIWSEDRLYGKSSSQELGTSRLRERIKRDI